MEWKKFSTAWKSRAFELITDLSNKMTWTIKIGLDFIFSTFRFIVSKLMVGIINCPFVVIYGIHVREKTILDHFFNPHYLSWRNFLEFLFWAIYQISMVILYNLNISMFCLEMDEKIHYFAKQKLSCSISLVKSRSYWKN